MQNPLRRILAILLALCVSTESLFASISYQPAASFNRAPPHNLFSQQALEVPSARPHEIFEDLSVREAQLESNAARYTSTLREDVNPAQDRARQKFADVHYSPGREIHDLIDQFPIDSYRHEPLEMRSMLTDTEIKAISRKYGRVPGKTPDLSLSVLEGFYYLFDQLFERRPSVTFKGAKVLLIGPREGVELFGLIARFPHISEIYIVTKEDEVFWRYEVWAHAWKLVGAGPLPKLYGYRTNALELPAELECQIDLAVSNCVFDSRSVTLSDGERYFDDGQMMQAAKEITRVLKSDGYYVSQSEEIPEFMDKGVMHLEDTRGPVRLLVKNKPAAPAARSKPPALSPNRAA